MIFIHLSADAATTTWCSRSYRVEGTSDAAAALARVLQGFGAKGRWRVLSDGAEAAEGDDIRQLAATAPAVANWRTTIQRRPSRDAALEAAITGQTVSTEAARGTSLPSRRGGAARD